MDNVATSNIILNSPIITCDIKNTAEYQKQLWETAKGDAHHDLSDVFKPSDYSKAAYMREAFNQGLPNFNEYFDENSKKYVKPPIDSNQINNLTEDSCLSSIILKINYKYVSDYKNDLSEKVVDVTKQPTEDRTIIEIGLKESETVLFEYSALQFIIGCKTDADLLKKACTKDFGATFFSNTKLNGNHKNASFIVDYNQHHFIEKLTTGAALQDNIIYYLMTPEVVNDPAGKTNIHNKQIFHGRDEGVRLVSCIQTTPTPIAFTKYNPYEINPLNNFYSNYDFSLLPIKKIYTGGKSERLIATLDINYDRENKVPFTDTIEDSKGENSITSVIGFLTTIILGLKKYFNKETKTTVDINAEDNLIFNFNSKVQQKRGGDWFQVLACHDAKNRTYTQILPDNGRGTVNGDDLGPVYFVTHDRIAVSYALLNGVNVIYLDYWGRVYVFKNSSDPFFNEDTTKPVENILLTEMRKYWRGELKKGSLTTYEHEHLKDSVFETFNIYNNTRDQIIEQFRNELKETLNSQNITDIEEIIEKDNENNTIDTITNHLKKLFGACVKFAFVLNNFTRIKIKTDEVNAEYKTLLCSEPPIVVTSEDNEDNQNNKKRIRDLNKNLNILKGVYDKFGDINRNPISIFLNWINKNSEKIDVFKAADKINLKEDAQNRYISLDFKGRDGEDISTTTDKYIFLPYIQVIEKRALNLVIEFLKMLEKLIIEKFIPKNVAQRGTRTNVNPIPTGFKFLNNVLNLISEATLLLQAKESDDTNVIDDVFDKIEKVKLKISEDLEPELKSDFTDNIIVNEDLNEIIKIKNGDKFSNSTEFIFDDRIKRSANGKVEVDENDDEAQTGGGWRDLKPKSYGINVICDVSIKQITWQLLTCNLLKGRDLNELADKKRYKRYKLDNAQSEQVETSEREREQKEFNKQQFMEKIRPVFTDSRELAEVEEKMPFIDSLSGILSGSLSGSLKKGGADPDESNEINNEPQENLLQDFNIGYHPLLPIYMLLSPFYYTLGPKAEGDPFFYTYFTYFNVLIKMVDVLENNYLNNSTDNDKILSAYFIGFTLRSFLFTSNTSEMQIKKILNVVDIPENGFSTFSLKNDSFSNLIMGTVHSTLDEDIAAFILLDSDLFNNFINNEVNIKGILEEGTSTENLPTYNILKEQIFNLLQRICSKINIDRGTPEINIVNEEQISNSETSLPSEPEENPEENVNNITAKGKYDLFKDGLYKNNIREGDQSKSAGGKTKKYKKKFSRKTIKLRHQ